MSFGDPFEDFKRKKEQGAAKPPPPSKSPTQERLEKISDYFPAFGHAPSTGPVSTSEGPHAPAARISPIPNLNLVALCNVLKAKGYLTTEEVRNILEGKS